jgi:hypothetical protein
MQRYVLKIKPVTAETLQMHFQARIQPSSIEQRFSIGEMHT